MPRTRKRTSYPRSAFASPIHCAGTLFVHLQRLSLSFHTRMRSGELLTNITSDTNVLRDALIEFVLTFISEFLTLLGMIVIMVTINWKLSLIVLAVSPVLVLLSLSALSQNQGFCPAPA